MGSRHQWGKIGGGERVQQIQSPIQPASNQSSTTVVASLNLIETELTAVYKWTKRGHDVVKVSREQFQFHERIISGASDNT